MIYLIPGLDHRHTAPDLRGLELQWSNIRGAAETLRSTNKLLEVSPFLALGSLVLVTSTDARVLGHHSFQSWTLDRRDLLTLSPNNPWCGQERLEVGEARRCHQYGVLRYLRKKTSESGATTTMAEEERASLVEKERTGIATSTTKARELTGTQKDRLLHSLAAAPFDGVGDGRTGLAAYDFKFANFAEHPLPHAEQNQRRMFPIRSADKERSALSEKLVAEFGLREGGEVLSPRGGNDEENENPDVYIAAILPQEAEAYLKSVSGSEKQRALDSVFEEVAQRYGLEPHEYDWVASDDFVDKPWEVRPARSKFFFNLLGEEGDADAAPDGAPAPARTFVSYLGDAVATHHFFSGQGVNSGFREGDRLADFVTASTYGDLAEVIELFVREGRFAAWNGRNIVNNWVDWVDLDDRRSITSGPPTLQESLWRKFARTN